MTRMMRVYYAADAGASDGDELSNIFNNTLRRRTLWIEVQQTHAEQQPQRRQQQQQQHQQREMLRSRS